MGKWCCHSLLGLCHTRWQVPCLTKYSCSLPNVGILGYSMESVSLLSVLLPNSFHIGGSRDDFGFGVKSLLAFGLGDYHNSRWDFMTAMVIIMCSKPCTYSKTWVTLEFWSGQDEDVNRALSLFLGYKLLVFPNLCRAVKPVSLAGPWCVMDPNIFQRRLVCLAFKCSL